MGNKKLRCFKCFITLERLEKDGIANYLIKIAKSDGAEDYICPTCFAEW